MAPNRKRARVPSRLEPVFVSRRHPGKRLAGRNVESEDGLARDACPLTSTPSVVTLRSTLSFAHREKELRIVFERPCFTATVVW